MFTRYPSITVTSVVEPFDDDSTANIRALFRNHVKFGRRLHIIDLNQLSSATGPVFRAMILALRAVREVGGDIRLVAARNGMRRVLTLTGLYRVFGVHVNVNDAMQAFRERPLKAG